MFFNKSFIQIVQIGMECK